jgi:hypothetical protein
MGIRCELGQGARPVGTQVEGLFQRADQVTEGLGAAEGRSVGFARAR